MKTIFPGVKPTKADKEKYAEHMKSWVRLNESYLLVDLTAEDMEKMITIEANGRNREHLLRKMVGKLTTLRRREIYSKLGIEE